MKKVIHFLTEKELRKKLKTLKSCENKINYVEVNSFTDRKNLSCETAKRLY